MIGQHALLDTIYKQIHEGVFPRFSIMVGPDGSERNEIASCIADHLNAICVNVPDCKVETIREIIVNAYKVSTLTVYNIQDADSMSVQAKNALLKVTEEPPNKAYFVMTLSDENNTLATIRSRGTVFKLDPYAKWELTQYGKTKYSLTTESLDIVGKIACVPGDVDLLVRYGTQQFYDFVSKVVDNIATASESNSLKISQSIKFKDTDESGYELEMFWKAFANICFLRGLLEGVQITGCYLSELHTKAINRSMLFDSWLFTIRKAWSDGDNGNQE